MLLQKQKLLEHNTKQLKNKEIEYSRIQQDYEEKIAAIQAHATNSKHLFLSFHNNTLGFFTKLLQSYEI